MGRYQVDLDLGREIDRTAIRKAAVWRGVSAEFVAVDPGESFAYAWTGESHYLALHNLQLIDGETVLDDSKTLSVLDLRGRMTFAPAGSRVTGWSALSPTASQGFTAVFFDPAAIAEEYDGRFVPSHDRPLLYFENQWLCMVLSRIQSLLQDQSASDAVYAETLGLMAVLEIDRLQRGTALPPTSGCLSPAQERAVRDYILDNLGHEITLEELAGIANLSRFHFTRAFKRSFGLPPYKYVLQSRLEHAKSMLQLTDMAIADIGLAVGFRTATHFSSAFRTETGVTPNRFRRSAG